MSHVVALNQIGRDMKAQSILTSQIKVGNLVGEEREIESQPPPADLRNGLDSVEPSCERFFPEEGNDRLENTVHVPKLSQNRRIARLTQLMRELQESRAPADTLLVVQ